MASNINNDAVPPTGAEMIVRGIETDDLDDQTNIPCTVSSAVEAKAELDAILLKTEKLVFTPVQKVSCISQTTALMEGCVSVLKSDFAAQLINLSPVPIGICGSAVAEILNVWGTVSQFVCNDAPRKGFVLKDIDGLSLRDSRGPGPRIFHSRDGDYDLVYKGYPVYQVRGLYATEEEGAPLSVLPGANQSDGQTATFRRFNDVSCCDACCLYNPCRCTTTEFSRGTKRPVQHILFDYTGVTVATIAHRRYFERESVCCAPCRECGYTAMPDHGGICGKLVWGVFMVGCCCGSPTNCTLCKGYYACQDMFCISNVDASNGVSFANAFQGKGPGRHAYQEVLENSNACCCIFASTQTLPGVHMANSPDSFTLSSAGFCSSQSNDTCSDYCFSFYDAKLQGYPKDTASNHRMQMSPRSLPMFLYSYVERAIAEIQAHTGISPGSLVSVPAPAGSIQMMEMSSNVAAAHGEADDLKSAVEDIREKDHEGKGGCCQAKYMDITPLSEIHFPPHFTGEQRLMAMVSNLLYVQNTILTKFVKDVNSP